MTSSLAPGLWAQNVPDANGPACVPTPNIPCPGGGSSSSDGSYTGMGQTIAVWKARIAAMKEANRKRREEQAAQAKVKAERKQAKDAAKAEAQRKKDEERAQAATDAARARAEAERQRMLAAEAKRLQDNFNQSKPLLVGSLKPSGNSGGSGGSSGGLNLKGPGGGATGNNWEASITDPQVAPMAHRLAKIVPPMPIPASQAKVDWKQVYLNDERLEKTGDLVIAGWETLGLIEESSLYIKMGMIVGKGILGDADGAYVFMTKRDEDYNAALAYLKNPAQARNFARLVDDLKNNRPVAADVDKEMLKTARLIANPKAASSTWVFMDAVTSREAISTGLRKAWVEAASDLAGYGAGKMTGGFFSSVAERKAVFDSILLERTAAEKMLADPATTVEKAEQLKALISHADEMSSFTYKFDAGVKRGKDGALGLGINDASDKAADLFFSKPAEAHRF